MLGPASSSSPLQEAGTRACRQPGFSDCGHNASARPASFGTRTCGWIGQLDSLAEDRLTEPCTLMNEFVSALQRFSDFRGRSRRGDFWHFVLVSVLIYAVAAAMDSIVGTAGHQAGQGWLASGVLLALTLPSLAVGSRRLHDTGLSGWWQLLMLVPAVGSLIVLVLMARGSQTGPNAFGPEPARR